LIYSTVLVNKMLGQIYLMFFSLPCLRLTEMRLIHISTFKSNDSLNFINDASFDLVY
jgi:hypothetical protein